MNKQFWQILLVVSLLISCSNAKRVDIHEHFWAPNTFTPNNDYHNETFNPIPKAFVQFSDYHIIIFDDQLNIVFESRDIVDEWDPVGANQNLPSGFYEYQIQYTCSEDSVNYYDYITNATVNLIR